MCQIIDLNPRLKAQQTAQNDLTELCADHVSSDKALERINRDLAALDEKIARFLYPLPENIILIASQRRRSKLLGLL